MEHRPLIFVAITAILNHLCPRPILSLEQGFVYCPAYPCTCNIRHGGLVIDCQSLQLTHLPKFMTYHGEIRKLSLKDNGIVQLPANAFRNLRVQSLDLTDNVISHVHPRAFEGLEDWLEELHLEMDGTVDIPSAAIKGLKKLRVLRIAGCKAHTLHRSVFEGLQDHLLELHLQNCSIQTIEPKGLSSLKLLQVLDMSGNLLTIQALSQISDLQELRTLVLSRNRLSQLPRYAFQRLKHLRYLDLSDNKITHVDTNAFKRLHNSLNTMKLQHNQLTGDVFLPIQHLYNLQQLNLGSNNITSIPKGSLLNMKFLAHLHLDNNGITELDTKTFAGTELSLQVLRIGNNPISVLNKDTFQDHISLQELALDNTRLGGTLREEMFHGINRTLRKLSISEADLTSFDLSSLSVINTLEDLDVSRNKIAETPHGTFVKMNNLKKLDLSQSHIRHLPDSVFKGLEASLVSVDLHDNALTTISSCVFDGFQNLKTLSLQGNPLRCDCGVVWLHAWLQMSMIAEDRASLGWRCAGPEALAGRQFGSLTKADLQCSDDSMMHRPLCDEDSSDADIGFEKVTYDDDTLTTFPPLPLRDIVEPSLHLEVQPKDHGSLLALWDVTLSPATPITGYRLTLHRRNDSKQEADMTLAAEVTQFLLAGLAGEMVYEACVTLLGDMDIPLTEDCVLSTTTSNSPAPVNEKVHYQTPSTSLPVSITALIWSYVSGCFIAFILCIVLAVVMHRRRRRRHQQQQQQQMKKSAPGFYPGYWAWEGNQSCHSSLDDISSSVYYLDASVRGRRPATHEQVIGIFDRHLGDDRGNKPGMKMFTQNLPGHCHLVFGKRMSEGGDFEGDASDSDLSKRLAEFDSISDMIDHKSHLEDSKSTLAKRDLEEDSFAEEDGLADLERKVLRMGKFGDDDTGLGKTQEDLNALRTGMFDKETSLWRKQDDFDVALNRSALEKLVGCGRPLKKKVREVKHVKTARSHSLDEFWSSLEKQKKIEQAVFNQDAELRSLEHPTDEQISAHRFEPFLKETHANSPSSSKGTLQRKFLRVESPRFGILHRDGHGDTDISVCSDALSEDGTVNPLYQHLPASFVLTSPDLAENVILQL